MESDEQDRENRINFTIPKLPNEKDLASHLGISESDKEKMKKIENIYNEMKTTAFIILLVFFCLFVISLIAGAVEYYMPSPQPQRVVRRVVVPTQTSSVLQQQ